MDHARWEYKTFKFAAQGFWSGGIIDTQHLEGELNKLGQDGWELVSVVTSNSGHGWTRDVVAVLKRPASA